MHWNLSGTGIKYAVNMLNGACNLHLPLKFMQRKGVQVSGFAEKRVRNANKTNIFSRSFFQWQAVQSKIFPLRSIACRR